MKSVTADICLAPAWTARVNSFHPSLTKGMLLLASYLRYLVENLLYVMFSLSCLSWWQFFVLCDFPHHVHGREVGSQNAARSRPIENPTSSRADIWKTTGKTRIIHNHNSSLRFGYFSNRVSLEYETQEAEQKLCVTYICASITVGFIPRDLYTHP